MIQLDTGWLQHVQKPARYTGGEWNSVVKNHADVDVTVGLAFPDVYEVSMSHLGIKILYALIVFKEPFKLLNKSIFAIVCKKFC